MSLEESLADKIATALAPVLVERVVRDISDPCLRPCDAARYLGIGRSSLSSLGLPRVYPTPGAPRYRLSVLNRHLDASS